MIDKIIEKFISRRGDEQIIVDDDGFLFGLFDKASDSSKRMLKRILNLLLLLCCAITCVVILIKAFAFYVHDVLLFENEVFMNQQGAFVPTQSCDREYAFFMFTSSDWWANTGVQVQKGDRVKILASGAFNSSVSDIVNRAKSNDTLKYSWVSAMPTKTARKDRNVKQCIYRGQDAYFGSVLYQIQNSLNKEISEADIKQLKIDNAEKEHFEEIDRNGTLFFAVNDIYLSPSILRENAEKNRYFANGIKRLYNSDSLIIQKDRVAIHEGLFRKYRDSIPLFMPPSNGFIEIAGLTFDQYFNDNPKVWYNDNIGDILICMEIEHVTDKSFAKWYRECESEFNILEDEKNVGFHEALHMTLNVLIWLVKAIYIFKHYIVIFFFLFMVINYSYIFSFMKIRLKNMVTLFNKIGVRGKK